MKSMNSEQPLVSVIMPTYNHAEFIGDAVKSVLDQTYANFELIIIDNYSEDNTEGIIASFNDTRIKYEKFRNNGIIAASRNVGISESRGKYIAFLDSDDIWLPNKLEKQVGFLEENADVFLVYTRALVMKNNLIRNKIMPLKRRLKAGNVFKSLFLSSNFIMGVTVMFRNKVKEKFYYFDEDIRLMGVEDFDLWLRISRKETIAFLGEPLAIYRTHEGNHSKGIKPYIIRNIVLINKWHIYFTKDVLLKKYIALFAYSIYIIIAGMIENYFPIIYRFLLKAKSVLI
jgi:glycosyltransferase involved in cell wall biosynthesis